MKPSVSQIARPRLVSLGGIRCHTSSRISLAPTALHRAEKASDIKAHPESALTQEKLPDKPGNRHWTEENATPSEADIKADREARLEESLAKGQVKKVQSSDASMSWHDLLIKSKLGVNLQL
ncbi:uncharacterized protein Z519_10494 [Cladophialophora bantiana CBS 173.52]|uniref:Uncharacterized protein n=1 Tax=Cladophialophora bantiana (strain ATCC 10958 / CBS 173.52 / CDC B-1940 / NIH 8579) TaxID=1442370 RepID=A0A0D2HWV2_CLAB1|nr:uncharacterized protein Z519_10494 [Cladophialophora bantiana CBS 173.52]KIW89009.1 hypothetical protein Z519_10494 [Cladophialophora bantiana CBS 173.52]